MSEDQNTEALDGEEGQEDTVDEIRLAFDEAVLEEADEDDIKMAMIGAGATFKNVTRFYNQYMIDAGMAISKEDRNQIVQDSLEGLEFDTEEAFDTAVGNLTDAIQGATERSAASLVRSYAKKNELECYTKPKGEGAGRTSFASKFYDFLVANPGMTEDVAKAYIMGEGDNEDTSSNVQNHLSHYLGIWKLARRVEGTYVVAEAA